MRKIRETLRLKSEGYSNRAIATSIDGSASTVFDYLCRAKAAGLKWPLPEEMDDDVLEEKLFAHTNKQKTFIAPDWSVVHLELKRKGVTKELLWQEYRANTPDGMSYSNFCQQYRKFSNTLCTSMRQNHKLGEKLFVDYAGVTVEWIALQSGEIHKAAIFVAVLGASNFTYVEATGSQNLPDWLMSHVRTFEYLGGIPECVVPDNLKTGVTEAHHYDPETNRSYQDLADHYQIAVLPARVRKPQDKSKVEVGVQGIERWILAPLRKHTFHSVQEINEAIRPLLEAYNQKSLKDLPGSRSSQFKQYERACLRPLPRYRYIYSKWTKAKVAPDYHVAYQKHYYSVPHKYIGQTIDLRISQNLIECFYKSRCIASHQMGEKGRHTTVKSHMPKSHQHYAEWTPERLLNWSKKAGQHTEAFIQKLLASRPMPQQSFRACLGVMRLMKSYGAERLELACKHALEMNAIRYKSVASILKNGLEKKTKTTSPKSQLPEHSNIRGKVYYT